jgi:hypothetical protein
VEGGVSVIEVFSHTHNVPHVARQEYGHAKQNYRDVLAGYDATAPGNDQRFQDACDRLDAARERWLKEMVRG